MKTIFEEMENNVNRVATTLENINHPRANEIRRIAQYFGDMSGSNTNNGFNPSIQPMASESPKIAPINENSLSPDISSYVKMKPGEAPVDDRKTHTCTVFFKAPADVSESDMMNYILGIGEQLGVDVESFKWSKSDSKQSRQAV